MKNRFLFLSLFFISFISAQKITLEEIRELALKKSPLFDKDSINFKKNTFEKEEANQFYLPKIVVNANATYQSDVTEFPDLFPGISFEKLPKDNYNLNVEIQQLLFDGGKTKKIKQLSDQQLIIDEYSNAINKRILKEKITVLFFQSIMVNKKKEILLEWLATLNKQKVILEEQIKEGISFKGDLYQIQIEILNIKQQIDEVDSDVKKIKEILTILSGVEFSENTELVFQNENETDFHQLERSENHIFEGQEKKMDLNIKLLNREFLPQLFLFGKYGYGRPNFNLLNPNFDNYYIFGLKMNWNISSFYLNKVKKNKILLQKKEIYYQKDIFNQDLEISLVSKKSDIYKIEKKIISLKEKEILEEKRCTIAKVQYENGIIPLINFLNEITRLYELKVNIQTVQIELLKEKQLYKYLYNDN